MIADVQISRVHKGSPYNVQGMLFDIEGKDENDIYNSIEVQKAIDETFGKELRVSIMPLGVRYHKDYYITKTNIMQKQKNKGPQKIGSFEHNKSILAKKQELLDIIKIYLKRGDMELIAIQLKCGISNIKMTLYGDRFSKKVITALYEKALQNKNELLFSYQKMIDELKK
jgi:hypothetical protein